MPVDQTHAISHIIFLIFFGTAVLSTLALFTRQSMLVAYIVLGALLGPWGLKLVSNSDIIKQAGDIGIVFLLFLLGLHLQPQNLFHSLRKMSMITLTSSFIIFAMAFVTCAAFGYNIKESLVIAIATIFSSTIIGLKLLPTTILHHQHTGELVISILLLQDILAILAILVIQIIGDSGSTNLWMIVVSFPVLLTVAYLFQAYVLSFLLSRFDKIHEYIFILSIGWCLLMAELSGYFGLSEEIGAFIAGVSLASNPISFYIAESLKPLRDFFLVLFFFSVGASFNFDYFDEVIASACILALFTLLLKPMIFSYLLQRSGEIKTVSWEIGVRLGQMSEFSILIIYMAQQTHLLSSADAAMAQAAIIITFIASCYWTVMRYPTPLAATDKLRRD